jgi:hypothetical protein
MGEGIIERRSTPEGVLVLLTKHARPKSKRLGGDDSTGRDLFLRNHQIQLGVRDVFSLVYGCDNSDLVEPAFSIMCSNQAVKSVPEADFKYLQRRITKIPIQQCSAQQLDCLGNIVAGRI